MKICLMSDSHGRTDRIDAVLARYSDIEMLIHAGDHANDVLSRKDVPWKTVCGNCDAPGSAGDEEIIDILGLKVLVTHGHLYRVKQTILPLTYRAKEVGADLVIFGHSHVPVILEEDGTIFCNPGSLSYPRGSVSVPTYGILEVVPFSGACRVDIQLYGMKGDPLPGFHYVHQFLKP
ncbi:metallophosphoesterase [Effusibacillus consociatus]|uniref:Phosphoesterase n=1 Tax=Effusibacillus consociatus TaxID=1117041 RepID=A0ABV9Q0S3_9BACL